jgi:hypothetical protein
LFPRPFASGIVQLKMSGGDILTAHRGVVKSRWKQMPDSQIIDLSLFDAPVGHALLYYLYYDEFNSTDPPTFKQKPENAGNSLLWRLDMCFLAASCRMSWFQELATMEVDRQLRMYGPMLALEVAGYWFRYRVRGLDNDFSNTAQKLTQHPLMVQDRSMERAGWPDTPFWDRLLRVTTQGEAYWIQQFMDFSRGLTDAWIEVMRKCVSSDPKWAYLSFSN